MGHHASVNSVAFSPDGIFLASGRSDKTVRLWTLANHQCQQIIRTESSTNTVAFSNTHILTLCQTHGCIDLYVPTSESGPLYSLHGKDLNAHLLQQSNSMS